MPPTASANDILPGLIDTPMAVDTLARAGNRRRAERDARVPLRSRIGTAWDVANAALFLASDEADFITGAAPGRPRCAGADRLTTPTRHAAASHGGGATRSSSNAAACVSAARFDEAVATAGSAPATVAVTVNRGAWSGPLVATSA